MNNKFPLNIKRIVRNKIKRAYCKWAISKKKKVAAEWTPFEKKFALLFKRAIITKDSTLYYSWETNSRLVHNKKNKLTIIIRSNSVKLHDDKTLISFFVGSNLQLYLDAIFDQAASTRAKAIETQADNFMLENLNTIELGLDRRKLDIDERDVMVSKFVTRRRPAIIEKDILQGANH